MEMYQVQKLLKTHWNLDIKKQKVYGQVKKLKKNLYVVRNTDILQIG